MKKIVLFFLFFVTASTVCLRAAISDGTRPQFLIYNSLSECRAGCAGTCSEAEFIGDDGTTTTQYRCSGSCSAGTVQNKYTATGCDTRTETRTCCSNGSWSGWDEDCPKDCTGEKPATSQACFSGYQTRTVTCVNGSWQTGTWSECDCTNSQYEWVDLPDNQGKCCQDTRCGTTGPNGEAYICCATREEVGNTWESWGQDQTYFCYNHDPLTGTILGCEDAKAGASCEGRQGEQCCVNFEVLYCR